MVTRRRTRAAGAALVTGAARRIGREIAVALAHDGWDIAVHYASSRDDALETVRLVEAAGRRAVAVNRDLAVEAGVKSLLAECAHELDEVTCIVNNASVFEYDDASTFAADTLARTMRTNVAAPVLLAYGLHESLAEHDRGVVINLLDQKLWNPNPDFLSYTLSKAALKEATVLLAQALAPRVRVVGIAPGITLPSTRQSEAGFAAAHAATPLRRSSQPEDIAAAAVFLAKAPSITGTTLLVDGGQHLLGQHARRDVPDRARAGRAAMTGLLDPRLADCRRLFLRNYVVDANIGIHAIEKEGAQRLALNVDLYVPLALSTPRHDKIHEVIDYDFIRLTIRHRIEQGHINLQETLVDDIARSLLAHPAVRAVRVASEKPDVYPDVDAVGIEVLHFKDEA